MFKKNLREYIHSFPLPPPNWNKRNVKWSYYFVLDGLQKKVFTSSSWRYMGWTFPMQMKAHRPLITCRGPTMSSMELEVEILKNERWSTNTNTDHPHNSHWSSSSRSPFICRSCGRDPGVYSPSPSSPSSAEVAGGTLGDTQRPITSTLPPPLR